MKLLGLSAFYHDSAAAIVDDGRVVVAAEEERFTRVKHAYQFPSLAIEFCLKQQGLTIDAIDYVVHYEKPLLRFERVLDNFVKTYPFSLRPFVKGLPEWIDQKLKVEQKIRKELHFKGKILYVPHHVSHASASFYPSGFTEAAILTIDGIGEYQTTGLWMGKKNKIIPLKAMDFPHSVGLFYSTFTAFLGFRVNEDEYKVMGLGAYGKPSYVDRILATMDLRDDGSFHFDFSYYNFREAMQMWSAKFESVFGKPRQMSDSVEQRHKDIAASCQIVTEMIYFRMLNELYRLTGSENLCIGGGVALNALANGKIYKQTPFKQIYIIGPAGDGGSAIGAPLFAYHHLLGKTKRHPITRLSLGSTYSEEQIESELKKHAVVYKRYSQKELLKQTSHYLANNRIVGWFQGGMEYGPRALGNRSILANPKPRHMKSKVNVIKIREQFRPFAGSILQDKVSEYFEVPTKKHWSPFMLFCFIVKEAKRSDLSAIVHKDNTCRIQTVSAKDNERYYLLIKEFYKLTGVPCILNTSFNLKGEPIVETPAQAIADFLKTSLDYLVIGDFIVERKGRTFRE